VWLWPRTVHPGDKVDRVGVALAPYSTPWRQVDRVGVALAPYSTPWRQSRKVHSGDRFGDKIDRIGNKVDRIGDKVDRRQCVPA